MNLGKPHVLWTERFQFSVYMLYFLLVPSLPEKSLFYLSYVLS